MDLRPEDCVAALAKGGRLSAAVCAVLDPPLIGSMHSFAIPFGRSTELHFHDHDEYWVFTEGRTHLQLRMQDGTTKEFEIEPYTIIATPKGVEHGHTPQSDVKGLQWVGPLRPGGAPGHLTRTR